MTMLYFFPCTAHRTMNMKIFLKFICPFMINKSKAEFQQNFVKKHEFMNYLLNLIKLKYNS